MTNNSQTQTDLENINRLLGDIQKKYAQLGEKSPFKRTAEEAQKGFKDTQSAIKGLEAALKEVNNRTLEANTSSKGLFGSLQKLLKDTRSIFDKSIKDSKNELKELSKEKEKAFSPKQVAAGFAGLPAKQAFEATGKVLSQSQISYGFGGIKAKESLLEKTKPKPTFLTNLKKFGGESLKLATNEFFNFLKPPSLKELENTKKHGREFFTKPLLKDSETSKTKPTNTFSSLSSFLKNYSETLSKIYTVLTDIKSFVSIIANNRKYKVENTKDPSNNESSPQFTSNTSGEKSTKAKAKKANDFMSNYGKRTLLTPTETILLNNEDTIIAGTKLLKGDDVISAPAGQFRGFEDIAKLFLGNRPVFNFLKNNPVINELVKNLNLADTLTGNLAKSFGISYNEAANLRNELTDISNLTYDININSISLQKALIDINKQFGTAAMLNGELLKDYTRLTEVAGYTAEAAAGLSRITVATGTDLSENTSEILGQAVAFNAVNGLALNEKAIVEAVAKTSAATTLSLGMQSGKIAEANLQAKALGTTLEKVEQIASSLLDFEQSISSELSAELLIGKDLNLERARLFALNNDMAGVAEEIAKQIGTAADFTKMNVIQQEALAKSVGMTREDLAKSLIEREALARINAKDADAAKEKFDKLVKQYGYEKAIKELGDEKYAQQLASQSILERANKAFFKLQDILLTFAEPILQIVSPFIDLVANILPLINIILTPALTTIKYIGESIAGWLNIFDGGLGKLTFMQKIVGAIGTLIVGWKVATMAYAAYQTIGAVAAISTASALSGGLLVATIIGGIIMGVGALKSASKDAASSAKTANDMVSPGYGKRTLLGPEGAIALNDKDTVIAGTKLFKGNDVINTNKDTLLSPENTVKLTNNNTTIDKNTSSVSKETLDKIISNNNNNTIDKTTSFVSKETLDKIISNNNTIDKTNKIIDGSSYKGNNLGVFENIFKGLNDTISLSLKEDNFQTSTNLVSEPIISEKESKIDNRNVTNNINNQQTNTPSFKDENNQSMINILSEIKGVLTNINNQKTTTVLEVDGQKLASSFNARTFKIQ